MVWWADSWAGMHGLATAAHWVVHGLGVSLRFLGPPYGPLRSHIHTKINGLQSHKLYQMYTKKDDWQTELP
jgi:hypothetical protein